MSKREEKVFEFAGASVTTNENVYVGKMWETVYDDDGRFTMETKHTYEHKEDEEGKSFKYKYVISGYVVDEERGDSSIDLQLAVLPDSMCEESRAKVAQCMGWEEGCGWELGARDVAEYGLGVHVGSELYDFKGSGYHLLDKKETKHVIKSICLVLGAIDSLRGFKLDSAYNKLGTTGWDVIEECLTGKDAIRASLGLVK
jgi:hypothetical protein